MVFTYQGKENGHDVWTEGVYYKVNLAIIRRGREVVVRNTYTGKEQSLGSFNTAKTAMKVARETSKSFSRAYITGGHAGAELDYYRNKLKEVA
jgi:hypothetical protein